MRHAVMISTIYPRRHVQEGLAVSSETQVVAKVTYQNLFRLFPKLSGMTGTAFTEAQELFDIYNLKVRSPSIHTYILALHTPYLGMSAHRLHTVIPAHPHPHPLLLQLSVCVSVCLSVSVCVQVLPIPTALPVARRDNSDAVFRTESGKMKALLRNILTTYESVKGSRPMLIGATHPPSSSSSP